MNITPSTARLTNTELASTVAHADTSRARTGFSNSLTRARRDGQAPSAPHPRAAPSEVAITRSGPVEAQPAQKPEAPAAAHKPATVADPDAGARAGIPGDINGDGRVDVFDSAILAAGYQAGDASADLDGSGTVDEVDATILRTNFGKVSEPEAAPIRAASVPDSKITPNADLNGDGRIDVLDFGQLIASYGKSNPNADLFQDGVIDDIDIAIFKQLLKG